MSPAMIERNLHWLCTRATLCLLGIGLTTPAVAQAPDSVLIQSLAFVPCADAWKSRYPNQVLHYPPDPGLTIYSSFADPTPGPALEWAGFYENTASHPIDPFGGSSSRVWPIPPGEWACISFAGKSSGGNDVAVFSHAKRPLETLTHALVCPNPGGVATNRPPRYERVPDHCEKGGRASFLAGNNVISVLFEREAGEWRAWVPGARDTAVEKDAIAAVLNALASEGTWFPCAGAGCCRAF